MSEQRELEFKVYTRNTGSAVSRKLRRQQMVPAIVYSSGEKSIPLSLDIKSAEKYSKKEYDNKIFTFKSDSKDLNDLKVLKKDVSYHTLTRKPLHIDFFSLDMNKKVRIHVEVNFTGKAKGVKESNGILNIIRRNIEIECLPNEIPESFSIDVSPLDINQNFHVSDLKIPEKIKLITDKKASLCGVAEISEEESKPSVVNTTAASSTEKEDKPKTTEASKSTADTNKKTK